MDGDARLMHGVAPEGVTRICITRFTPIPQGVRGGGCQVEAADACASRRSVLAAFLPGLAKLADSIAAFSLPFDSCKSLEQRRAWFAAVVVTSLNGSQDFAAAVTIKRKDMEDKTLQSPSVAKALARWMAANPKLDIKDIRLNEFLRDLHKHATGMLLQVTREDPFAYDKFCKAFKPVCTGLEQHRSS